MSNYTDYMLWIGIDNWQTDIELDGSFDGNCGEVIAAEMTNLVPYYFKAVDPNGFLFKGHANHLDMNDLVDAINSMPFKEKEPLQLMYNRSGDVKWKIYNFDKPFVEADRDY